MKETQVGESQVKQQRLYIGLVVRGRHGGQRAWVQAPDAPITSSKSPGLPQILAWNPLTSHALIYNHLPYRKYRHLFLNSRLILIYCISSFILIFKKSTKLEGFFIASAFSQNHIYASVSQFLSASQPVSPYLLPMSINTAAKLNSSLVPRENNRVFQISPSAA